ncbi:thioesterase domain-containing protein, partial [Bacillus cereus]|nr:thioesterase domain-containing protein [Bacillus cereus]
ILRADFKIVETYIHDKNTQPCDIDFLIFNGENDEFTTYDQVIKWERYTSKTCTFHSFEGNHFFLNENIEEIANSIKRKLDSKRLSNSF